jgi:hypothetical protein
MLDTDTVNPKTLGERVAEWLDNWVPDNRHIIDEFTQLAFDAKAAGYHHHGGQALYEYMRFNRMIKEKRGDYKLNNNNVGMITRYVMIANPELEGFFREKVICGVSAEKAKRIFELIMRTRGELV